MNTLEHILNFISLNPYIFIITLLILGILVLVFFAGSKNILQIGKNNKVDATFRD